MEFCNQLGEILIFTVEERMQSTWMVGARICSTHHWWSISRRKLWVFPLDSGY